MTSRWLGAVLVVGLGVLLLSADGGPARFGAPAPIRAQEPSGAPLPSPTQSAPTPSTSIGPAFVFPVPAQTAYSGAHHDYPATDVFAPCGSDVLAPFAGTVSEATTEDVWNGSTNRGEDRGGLSVTVVGADGVRFYASHLSRVDVALGHAVAAGERLGLVGDTGSASGTPCHVHIGLSPAQCGPGDWWNRRGVLSPFPFLQAWQRGEPLDPSADVAAWHAQHGCPTAPLTYP